ARSENSISFAETKAAAKFSSARRVFTEAELYDAIGIHRLLQLDGNNPRVTVRHCPERPDTVVGGAVAPTAVAALVAAAQRSVFDSFPAEAHTGESAEVSAGDTLRQSLFERFDNRIDDRRKWLRVVSHRRCWMRTEDLSFREDEF